MVYVSKQQLAFIQSNLLALNATGEAPDSDETKGVNVDKDRNCETTILSCIPG
jgi:ABC-type uncharacterized transport system permease subunit